MSLLASLDKDLSLSLPQFFCCNCGDVDELRAVGTPLSAPRSMRSARAAGFELLLPYCRRCAKTATRRPASLATKVLIATLLGVCMGLIAAITPLGNMLGVFAFYLIGGAVFAIVFASYRLQKPRASQTSYYQPVQLVRMQRETSGRVAALTLSFAHPRYARVFAKANAEAISRGTLEVLGG